MSAPTLSCSCVLFALAREAATFRRSFRFEQRFPHAPCRAEFRAHASVRVLDLETGIGPERIGPVLDWVLNGPKLGNLTYRPSFVLSAGYSGGLDETLAVGDVVLATEVIDESDSRWPTTWPGSRALEALGLDARHGPILALARLVGDPAEKRRLGERFGALAVDMETATVAQRCAAAGVPFGCVRVISDAVATPLSPRLLDLVAGGRLSITRLVFTLATTPGLLLGDGRRLGRQTAFASRQLGQALQELLCG